MSSDEPFLFRTFGDASKEVVCFCSGGPDHTLDFSDDFCAALAVNGFFVMKFAQSKKMNYPVVSFMGILIRFSVSEFLLQSTPIGIFLGVVAAISLPFVAIINQSGDVENSPEYWWENECCVWALVGISFALLLLQACLDLKIPLMPGLLAMPPSSNVVERLALEVISSVNRILGKQRHFHLIGHFTGMRVVENICRIKPNRVITTAALNPIWQENALQSVSLCLQVLAFHIFCCLGLHFRHVCLQLTCWSQGSPNDTIQAWQRRAVELQNMLLLLYHPSEHWSIASRAGVCYPSMHTLVVHVPQISDHRSLLGGLILPRRIAVTWPMVKEYASKMVTKSTSSRMWLVQITSGEAGSATADVTIQKMLRLCTNHFHRPIPVKQPTTRVCQNPNGSYALMIPSSPYTCLHMT